MLNSRRSGALLVRGMLLVSAFAGMLWSAAALPSFRRMVPARDAAMRIIVDDRFRPGVLKNVLAGINAEPALMWPQPELIQARALIRLRLTEEAVVRKSSEEADLEISAAQDNVKSALAANPGDSFLWLLLYSVETARNGFDPQNVSHLNQSYAAGPHEGWISLRRNRLALAVFPMLGEPMRSLVTSEFAGMVDADFVDDSAVNLMGTGWRFREQLLGALGSTDVVSKQNLSKRLAADGVRLRIPGVEYDERPWR